MARTLIRKICPPRKIFQLLLMEGQAECRVWANMGARTPICARENYYRKWGNGWVWGDKCEIILLISFTSPPRSTISFLPSFIKIYRQLETHKKGLLVIVNCVNLFIMQKNFGQNWSWMIPHKEVEWIEHIHVYAKFSPRPAPLFTFYLIFLYQTKQNIRKIRLECPKMCLFEKKRRT